MIISDGIEQIKKLKKFLGEKELHSRGDIMHYHVFDNDGKYLSWDYAGVCGYPLSKIFQPLCNDYGQYVVVLTTNVLNGKVKLPWVYVEDEQHPPKGFRLVTDEEMKTTKKPMNAKFWEPNNSISTWLTTDGLSYSWIRATYCIPKGTVLEPITPKTVKMTVSEICKALGTNIEIIEG